MPMSAAEIERADQGRACPTPRCGSRIWPATATTTAPTSSPRRFAASRGCSSTSSSIRPWAARMGGELHALALTTSRPDVSRYAKGSNRDERVINDTHPAADRGRRRRALHEGHAGVPDVRLLGPGGAGAVAASACRSSPTTSSTIRAAAGPQGVLATGRPSRSSTSRASWSAAATSSARCTRAASCSSC